MEQYHQQLAILVHYTYCMLNECKKLENKYQHNNFSRDLSGNKIRGNLPREIFSISSLHGL